MPRLVHRALRRDQHVGGKGRECAEIHVGAEQEDAAVPRMVARREHRLGLVQRRLLDKACDLVDPLGDLFADLDPAITGFRRIGRDAERDQPALRDQRQRGVDRDMERVDICDDMVRRHDQQRLGPAARGDRGKRDGGGGVTAHRFEDHRLRAGLDRVELFVDHVGMARIGDHDRRGEAFADRAFRGQLQHGFLGGQRQHLLGALGPRHRP